jgi:hypothetical protein
MGGGAVLNALPELNKEAIGIICEQITRRVADRWISPDPVRTLENHQGCVGAMVRHRVLELCPQSS